MPRIIRGRASVGKELDERREARKSKVGAKRVQDKRAANRAKIGNRAKSGGGSVTEPKNTRGTTGPGRGTGGGSAGNSAKTGSSTSVTKTGGGGGQKRIGGGTRQVQGRAQTVNGTFREVTNQSRLGQGSVSRRAAGGLAARVLGGAAGLGVGAALAPSALASGTRQFGDPVSSPQPKNRVSQNAPKSSPAPQSRGSAPRTAPAPGSRKSAVDRANASAQRRTQTASNDAVVKVTGGRDEEPNNSFGGAFKKAREAGQRVFTHKGKRFTTRRAGESREDFEKKFR